MEKIIDLRVLKFTLGTKFLYLLFSFCSWSTLTRLMALQWYKCEGLLKNPKLCSIFLYFGPLVDFNVLGKAYGTEIRVADRTFLLYAAALRT